jgi:hypothetical protein
MVNYGKLSLMLNITLTPPIFSAAMIDMVLPFRKGCCGLSRLLRWDICEKYVVGGRLDFVRTNGLDYAVLLPSSGKCTPL